MQEYFSRQHQICPHCGSGEIHLTGWTGFVERCVIRVMWDLRPFRCRSCAKRFYLHSLPERTVAKKMA